MLLFLDDYVWVSVLSMDEQEYTFLQKHGLALCFAALPLLEASVTLVCPLHPLNFNPVSKDTGCHLSKSFDQWEL